MIWRKLGLVYNPMEEYDRPMERWNFAQGENVLIYDNFVRVYFCSREKPNERGQTVSRVFFLDLDKKNIKNILYISPSSVLELGEIGTFDEFGTYPFCPIRVNELIYGYYGGVTRCESVPFNVAIGLAVSKDNGKSFHKIGRGPILSYTLDEPFVICSPKVRYYNGEFYMFYSAGKKWTKTNGRPEICYKLRMAKSKDGIVWKKMNREILPDKLGDDESQACGDVIFKNGKYHMFYCYRKNIDFRTNKANSYRIGYAWSCDLVNWERKDEKVGITVSANPKEFDSDMVAYPNVFELEGDIYMLYLGNEVGKLGFAIARLEGELL